MACGWVCSGDFLDEESAAQYFVTFSLPVPDVPMRFGWDAPIRFGCEYDGALGRTDSGRKCTPVAWLLLNVAFNSLANATVIRK